MEPEYVKRFLDAYRRGTEGLQAFSVGACPGCERCGLDDEPSTAAYDMAQEPHFSWSSCEVCSSPLGGDRHPAHYWNDGDETVSHLSVCVDCLLYTANGDMPTADNRW